MGLVGPHSFYLIVSLAYVAFAVALAVVRPRERASMLWSGVLLVPFAFLSGPLVADRYWSPGRVTGGVIGIEDILWCLGIGAIAWGAAAWGARLLPRLAPLAWRFARRCGLIGLLGAAVFLGLWAGGAPFQTAFVVPNVVVMAVFLILRPGWRRLILRATLIVALFYGVTTAAFALILGGEFALMWSREGILGPLLAGIPIEEYLWGATFAGAWVPTLLFASETAPPGPARQTPPRA